MSRSKLFSTGRIRDTVGCGVLSVLFAGCAVGPDYARPTVASADAPAWFTPLPHQGQTAHLVDWWQRWNDPALSALLTAAQTGNPTIAQSAARIAQARAIDQSLRSVLFPSFTGSASDVRSKGGQQAQFGPPGGDGRQRSQNVSADLAWELDLFGGGRRGRAASQQRLAARKSDWHDARVLIAAEVATQYVNLRACEVLLTGYEIDAKSRGETSRLTELKRQAGFEAPANAALATASAAEANGRFLQQAADCDALNKVLAELTAMPEAQLRTIVAAGRAQLPQLPNTAGFKVTAVPAAVISQRPDVASAERELMAATADIGVAIADRLPRLSLTGSIGYSALTFGGTETRGQTWNYGPFLSLPIFDAGRRAANVDAARARADEAAAAYKARVLRAVREVEESLVRLDSATKREADVNQALAGYQQFLNAAQARVKFGAGSLPELEEARRLVVVATGSAVGVARDRLTAWIALYRAVGGGWDANNEQINYESTNN